MNTPITPEEITPAWLSHILNKEVDPASFQLTPNVQDGVGFLSNLVRVSCAESETGDPIQLVVKLQPKNDYLEFLRKNRLDEKEIFCCKEMLPKLVEHSPADLDLRSNFCDFIYGSIEESPDGNAESYRSILVLQDLKPAGYRTIDFGKDLSMAQLKQGVEFLAKFHAASYAMENSLKKSMVEVYPRLAPLSDPTLNEMLPGGFKFVSEDLLAAANSPSAVLAGYKKLAAMAENMFERIVLSKKEYPCIIHADLWPNNLLYAADDKPVKVIDWQIVSYNDPTFDLMVLLITGLTTEMLSTGIVEELLQFYYRIFVDACTRSNVRNIRSYADLSKYFYTFGVSYAMVWLILSAEVMATNSNRLARMFEFLETELKVSQICSEICS